VSSVGVARVASLYSRGFDCLEPVSSQTIRRAVASGFGGFVVRYLETLTIPERDDLFAAGVPILLATEARVGEPLSAATGHESGAISVQRAQALRAPSSVHVMIDLERPAAGSNVPAHVNTFSAELSAASFGPLLYVGQPQPCTSSELFHMAPSRYWKAAGRIVDDRGELAEPSCGWCIVQCSPLEQDLFGQVVDVDFIQADNEGRLPILWWPS
jgi:hypothetical protein